MTTIQETEQIRSRLEQVLTTLIKRIGAIKIGNTKQFPYGWRKAAKGRTVWRILEEAINQNLEIMHKEFGISTMETSDSEVSIYDSHLRFENSAIDIFINIKSAMANGRTNKDDISKAIGLDAFFTDNIERQLFICTFVINFLDDMTIEFVKCYVMPIAWLPDIYVNPSNNGNLQSSKYKETALATKRTNQQFLQELKDEMKIAQKKKEAKSKKN
jgi:hypothetical protein